ncbi:MAG: ribose-phosphate diphosphokinase [Rhodospirillaceae bacterium]|nr:ribose-phosphate diphosphokinase [Rhodospirillaceae bacterium]
MSPESSSANPAPPWSPDKLFAFAECAAQAKDLAQRLKVECEIVDVHYFPDSECRVQVKGRGMRPAIYRPLHLPNAKLIEIILAASVLRGDGARDIGLIAPYLPYMRQDIAFRPGEAVSQKVIGRLLADHFDRLVAVDPHLHRTATLAEVFAGKPALALSGAVAMSQHLKARNVPGNVLILGPDSESEPLARAVAEPLSLPHAVAAKDRAGDRDVRIVLPAGVDVNRRSVVIVDDIISSGGTILTLAKTLRDLNAKTVDVYTTHALYDERTAHAIAVAGVRKVVSCDGIAHPSNAMSIAAVIAEGLAAWR